MMSMEFSPDSSGVSALEEIRKLRKEIENIQNFNVYFEIQKLNKKIESLESEINCNNEEMKMLKKIIEDLQK